MKKQIVNIINFVRAVEPRLEMDLVKPVKEQIRLMKKHKLKGTFLLQYDAMLREDFVEIFKTLDPSQFELGVWHEVVQPQVEDCGLIWRGRYPWDWHTHCGFPVGYSKENREKLVDVLYEKFKSIFGYYPRVFGSWLFDTHTARYVADHYGADAFCNCKEQFGTDGYTLWGGYYGQGYYPSRENVFMPAQQPENQIPVPLFRMLGSDPVYQYDFLIDPQREEALLQHVISLEPVYQKNGGGGCKVWVDWFMKENFNGECLSFGYAQAGQENSFGWDAMKDGLIYQFALFEKLRDEGKISVEQLGETGRWYRQTYDVTPASAIVAHTAFDGEKHSVWYSNRNYRVNLYGDQGEAHIRDLHIFSEKLADPYEDTVCTENYAVYETLPVIDGNRYTGKGVLAGGYLRYQDGETPDFGEMEFVDNQDGSALVRYGDVMVLLEENGIRISAPKPFLLENRMGIDGGHMPKEEKITSGEITLSYGGVSYPVFISKGSVLDARTVISEENQICLKFKN